MNRLALLFSLIAGAVLAAGNAWGQAARFVGAWSVDAGTNRQRTVVIAQDGENLRARWGNAEPDPRLGPAEATLAADGTLTLKSNAGTLLVLTLADDNTMTGRWVPSSGRESTARTTRMPTDSAAVLAAARPAGTRAAAPPTPPAEAASYLPKADVEAIANGKKWKLHRFSDGHDVLWDLREGGRLFGRNLTQNTGDTGNWSVNDKGELCVKWRGNSNDSCLAVAREGDGYKTYNAAQPGKPFHALAVE